MVLRDGDDDARPRLKRSFSAADGTVAEDLRKARERALKTVSGRPSWFDGTHSGKTFALPNRSKLPEKIAQGLYDSVVDSSARSFFESRGLINWCDRATTLYPLETVGDGNCLLHALSLGMIGVHDRGLTLRTALHRTLLGNSGLVFRQRWQRAQAAKNKLQGFDLEDEQWEAEWNIVVGRAKEEGNSLEDIHILALSHILLRPIIVYAPVLLEGPEGEGVAPVEMGGVYLPLECDPKECYRDPLLVGYYNGHFVPFVTEAAASVSRNQDEDMFAIVRKDGQELDVQFRTEDDDDAWACTAKFLSLSHLEVRGGVVFAASRKKVLDGGAEAGSVVLGLIRELQSEEEERRRPRLRSPEQITGGGGGGGVGEKLRGERVEEEREREENQIVLPPPRRWTRAEEEEDGESGRLDDRFGDTSPYGPRYAARDRKSVV